MLDKQTMMYILQLAIFITMGIVMFKNHLDNQELRGEICNLKGIIRMMSNIESEEERAPVAANNLSHDIDNVFNKYSFTLNQDDISDFQEEWNEDQLPPIPEERIQELPAEEQPEQPEEPAVEEPIPTEVVEESPVKKNIKKGSLRKRK